MRRRTLLGTTVALAITGALPSARVRAADSANWRLDPEPIHAGLGSPVGMAYDRAGQLYVANWSAGTVLRLSPSGEAGILTSGLSGPSGLAISATGDIFVASYNDDLIWRFTQTGTQTVFVRGLATPAGLSFDARGRLLIANRRTNQILAAYADGRIEVAAEGLQTPVGAVDLPNGDLMVSNIAGGISFVGADRKARTINTDLRSPGPGIARAAADAVYVVDYGGSTVSRIDQRGHRVIVADGLSSPAGLTMAPDGNLMVATWGSNAIFRIRKP